MNIKVLLILPGDWRNAHPLLARDAGLRDNTKVKSILCQVLGNESLLYFQMLSLKIHFSVKKYIVYRVK